MRYYIRVCITLVTMLKVFLVIAILITAGCDLDGGPIDWSKVKDNLPIGGVSGKIRDSSSNKAIASVDVCLIRASSGLGDTLCTVSSDSGFYHFSIEYSGRYKLIASHKDYKPYSSFIDINDEFILRELKLTHK